MNFLELESHPERELWIAESEIHDFTLHRLKPGVLHFTNTSSDILESPMIDMSEELTTDTLSLFHEGDGLVVQYA